MSKFLPVLWTELRAGDYIRVTWRGYGRREGRLTHYQQAENSDWVWLDENDKPLLDPWWAQGTVEKLQEEA